MILSITNDVLVTELNKIGVHPASVEIFKKRAVIEPIKIFNMRMPAANILKQEAISAGADCAIHCGCVTGCIEYSDVLLLGSRKQYEELLRKLKPMTFFGLPELCDQLKEFLLPKSPQTVLADGRTLDYSSLSVMGIVNLTKDSFYKASCKGDLDEILATVEEMLLAGAEVIDLGAESTRPGAQPLSSEMECEQLLPAIATIKKEFPQSVISVDTYRAQTARQAIESGADIINDISAAADPDMIPLIAKSKIPIIIMHFGGDPQTMTPSMPPEKIDEVWNYLGERKEALNAGGITNDKIILDPGFGFGKTMELNLMLANRLKELTSFGLPVLLGASRKGTIRNVLELHPDDDRLMGTIALSCQAAIAGAQMVRVHDVKENIQAIRMMEAVRKCR